MTIRLSTGLCNKMLDGGVSGGLKGAFNGCFIAIFAGSQPSDADTGAGTAVQLGKVSVNDDGSTGLTFASASGGIATKTLAETWRFHGLTSGTAGWFRVYQAGDTITADSTTYARLDGSIGTSGSDMNISNTAIVLNAITTVDSFSVQLPKA